MTDEEIKYSFEIVEKSYSTASKNFWSPSVTTTFLELYKLYIPLLSNHRVQAFYEVLSTKLEEATGLNRSTRDLQKKFSNLTRTYRNCLKKESQKHEKFPFFKAMHEILHLSGNTVSSEHLEHDLNFQRIENNTEIKAEANFFPKKEVKALIHLYAKEKIVCEAKLIDWNKISSEHRKTGYNRSPKECRLKLHNLLRSYKSCVANNVTPSRCKFIYFDEFQQIFENGGSIDFDYKEYEQQEQITSEEPEKIPWTEEELAAFEICYKQSEDWSFIASQLEQAGFPDRSPDELQEKWKSLKESLDIIQVDNDNKKLMGDLNKVFGEEEVFVEEVLEEVVESKHSFNWTSKETKVLVDTYKSLDIMVRPGDKWEAVSENMKMCNIIKTAGECAKKWYNLIRSYRLCLHKFLETGNKPTKFFYFDEFKEIYGTSMATVDATPTKKRYVKRRVHNLTTEEIESQLIEECVDHLPESESNEEHQNVFLDLVVVEWSYESVEAMIDSYHSLINVPMDDDERWSSICEDLDKKDFVRSPEDCRIKFEELEEEYHKCLKDGEHKQFRFFDLMHLVLGDPVKEFPTELSKQKAAELIRVKNAYSIQLNTEILSDETWKNIADDIGVNIAPAILSSYYNDLLNNYQIIKQMHQNEINMEVFSQFFQEFDEIFAEEYEIMQDYEVMDDFEVEKTQITEEVEEIKKEVNEKQLQDIADNFMRFCKFCLKQNKEEHLRTVTDDMAEKINYVLHEKKPKLVLSISNLICSSCHVNIDHMYLYKKQYEENLNTLKDFSEKYSVLPPEAATPVDSNSASNYDSFDEQPEISEEPEAESENNVLKKIFNCQYCDKTFRNQRLFLKHRKEHPGKKYENISDYFEQSFKCSQCSLDFDLEENLNIHVMNSHPGGLRKRRKKN